MYQYMFYVTQYIQYVVSGEDISHYEIRKLGNTLLYVIIALTSFDVVVFMKSLAFLLRSKIKYAKNANNI